MGHMKILEGCVVLGQRFKARAMKGCTYMAFVYSYFGKKSYF